MVEELQAAGLVAHLAEAAETSSLRGPKRRAKTDRADARLLRKLLEQGRLPSSWIPPGWICGPSCGCAKVGDRFAALQPIHDAVVDRWGRLDADIARGLQLRHDWGPQYRSAHFGACQPR